MHPTMPSERIQRRIDRLLDQAEAAADSTDWSKVIEFVAGVLALDAENEDALAFREMADKASAAGSGDQQLSDGSVRTQRTFRKFSDLNT